MKSRQGVVLKNPTMAQRKAIVAIAQSEDIYHNEVSLLDESFEWVWFTYVSERLTGCLPIPHSKDKYVSFKKFVEYMYQEEAEEVIPIAIWKCTKELINSGKVSFKKGGFYEQDKDPRAFQLINEQGLSHWIGDWKQHFYQVK